MPQQKSLKDNCTYVMDNVIKNLNPVLKESILNDVVSSDVIKNSKKDIESFIRNKLGLFTTNSRHTRQYWILRGWSDDESYIKAKENKQKNLKSVYSREFWLERINPTTNKSYTPEEADFERNSRRPIRKEYWIKKGYSNDDAIKLANEAKDSNNKKGANNNSNSSIRRITSKRCIEYYTARGYSEDESKKLVSEGQKYFSKDICIEKYGKDQGIKIWQKRQDQWQEKINAKPPEERDRINRLKMTKGITISKAEIEISNKIENLNSNLTVIKQLALSSNNKKQYIYDIAVNNKIVEYNGDFWHCNPKIYSPDFINPRTKIKAVDKWNQDQEKIKFAQEQGYEVMVVWESEFKQNKEEILKKCVQFLTQ